MHRRLTRVIKKGVRNLEVERAPGLEPAGTPRNRKTA